MKALLIDLDGVIYQGEKLIPGAVEAIHTLQHRDIPHLFVTNTSSRPRRAIVEKLAAFGIVVAPQEVLTPAVAAAQWLCEHQIQQLALLLPEQTAEDLIGFERLPIDGDQRPQAIVVGDLGRHWSFDKLNCAFRWLMAEPKPALIALGMTRYWGTVDQLTLDVAPFVKALEFASDSQARVLGKPSRTFFHEALHILGCEAADVAMIGDDIRADVQGAQQAGMIGMLVKTGKYRDSDMALGIAPAHLLDSIADLPHLL